jgi:hypothetical protein
MARITHPSPTARVTSFFLLCTALLWPFRAWPFEGGCPESISVEQKIVDSPTSWNVTYDTVPHRLASVTFYDGPPAEMASLAYDKQLKRKSEWTALWYFQPHSERGYWLSCGYDRTSVVLSKQLPLQVAQCEVTYLKGRTLAGLPVIKRIECKEK